MALVTDRPQDVADWVAAQSGREAPSVDSAIGLEVDGALKAGVYFDGLTTNNVMAHIASSATTMPPALLQAVAQYVYRQLGLTRMSFPVSSGDLGVLDFVLGMGARQEAVLRRGCDPHDLILFVLWEKDYFPQRLLNRGVAHGQ